MLANCTKQEYTAAIDAARRNAIPGDVPAWLSEMKACPVCQNSGEPCGWCGWTRAEAEPLPTIAILAFAIPANLLHEQNGDNYAAAEAQ